MKRTHPGYAHTGIDCSLRSGGSHHPTSPFSATRGSNSVSGLEAARRGDIERALSMLDRLDALAPAVALAHGETLANLGLAGA